MVLKNHMKLQNYYTNPNSDFAYLIIVGIGHSFSFCTFESFIHVPLGVTAKPQNIVLLQKKLYFLSLQ